MKSTTRVLLFLVAISSAAARANAGVDRFTNISPPGRAFYITDIALHPSDASVLFVSTELGVLKSTDGGNSWSKEKLGLSYAHLTIDARQPAILFAANESASRSADGGETWTTIVPGKRAKGVAIDPSGSANVYAVLADGLARSTDGGFEWTQIGIGQVPLGYYGFDGLSIAVDPQVSTKVYAAGGGGLSRSSDAGATWQTLIADPLGDFYFRKILIDPRKPSTVYALAFRAVYRSDNGGESWKRTYTSSADTYLMDFEYDPLQPTRLYMATSTGLLISRYRGNEWQAFDEGIARERVSSVGVDSAGNVYAATESALFINTPRHELSPGGSTISVSLRTIAGNYISANDCGGMFVHANADDSGPCETFVMRDLNGGQLVHGDAVLLQAADGAFFVAEGGERDNGEINANRGIPSEWETFVIRSVTGQGGITSGDSVTLTSSRGTYVSADGGGKNGCGCDSRLTADRAAPRQWETFVLVIR